jgi:hypothetical protein
LGRIAMDSFDRMIIFAVGFMGVGYLLLVILVR